MKEKEVFPKAVTLVSPTLGKGVGGIENAFETINQKRLVHFCMLFQQDRISRKKIYELPLTPKNEMMPNGLLNLLPLSSQVMKM